jgi:hypothetical protein
VNGTDVGGEGMPSPLVRTSVRLVSKV